jgi:hypothetical protein
MAFKGNSRWIIAAGVACVFVFLLVPLFFRHESNSSHLVSPSPVANESPADKQKEAPSTQKLAVPAGELVSKEEPLSEPPAQTVSLPPLDQTALEAHRTMVADLNAKLREATKALYGSAFRQLHLPENAQNKVLDILTQGQLQLEQQAFEAAQSGTLPVIPSPGQMEAQVAQQEQQLRSVLGEAGYQNFNQYRATIPDRTVINGMNQQGANLNENQSQQLLQILTDARQQISGQGNMAQNLDSLSPSQAVATMRQQQNLLQQTVSGRVQNILTPQQASTLQSVMSQQGISPKTH